MTRPAGKRCRKGRRPGRPPQAEGVQGRELLLRAARELMIGKGFPRVTVREVAQRAGVGPALVNYYFGGKSDLFAAIIEQVVLEARERIEQATQRSGPVKERIHRFVQEIVAAMTADPYLARLLVEQVRDFPHADHDDGPDALEMAARLAAEMLNRGPEETTFTRIRLV